MMASRILLLDESRIDRFLVGLGLVLSLSVGFLLVTQSQDTEFLGQTPVIGTIKTPVGVNRRHARALSWGKIENESALYLKDMIYTPQQSSAEVILNSKERLTLEPDSMVEFDSVSSDRFNIVLIQGTAKIVSDKGTTRAVLPSTQAVEVRVPEVQKPQLPVFFIDTKSWETAQKELVQSVYAQLKSLRLLGESTVRLPQFSLNSVSDYQLGLSPVQISKLNDSDGPWYQLSWTTVPVKGTVYELEVSRSSNFSPSIKHETQTPSLDVQFLEEGKHYWRVTARNGSEKIQSAADSFNTSKERE